MPKEYLVLMFVKLTKVNIAWACPAKLKPQKRPEFCVELAKGIGETYDVLMVGKIQDSYYEWLKNASKIPKNLKYLGAKTVSEVNGIIFSSICLIHTCTPEGFPGNFVQAWQQGKPVVSYEYDPGGLINSKKLGLVSNNKMNQFISDTKKIIETPALREEIGERAKKYADKHFHPETNVRKLENFLFDVVQNSKTH